MLVLSITHRSRPEPLALCWKRAHNPSSKPCSGYPEPLNPCPKYLKPGSEVHVGLICVSAIPRGAAGKWFQGSPGGTTDIVWVCTDLDVPTEMFTSPFMMCKGTKDGEGESFTRGTRMEESESPNPIYSVWPSICTLALSPENVRGGPIWPGICKLSWDWRARRGGAIPAEGHTWELFLSWEKDDVCKELRRSHCVWAMQSLPVAWLQSCAGQWRTSLERSRWHTTRP